MLPDTSVTYVPDCTGPTLALQKEKTSMRDQFQKFALLLALLVVAGVEASAQTISAARRDSVVAAMRAFVDAGNRVDVQALVDAYSKSANVSSAGLGEIHRGWEAIRAQNDSLAGMEGVMKLSLGAMDVTALGASHTLVVSSVAIRVETDEGPVQLRGALTMVFERVGGAWKILHEHLSLPIPEG